MELILKRFAKEANYTIGHLYVRLDQVIKVVVDGELVDQSLRYLCDTLEPKYRNLKHEAKIPGSTAIPVGRYRILITKSHRFNRWLPILLDVPYFQGVRIHPGNYPEDTRGCILPGWNRCKGMVVNSRAAMQNLMYEMNEALNRDEKIWITINNEFKR